MPLDLLGPDWLALKLPKAVGRRELWPLICDGVLCLLQTGEAEIEPIVRRWWLDGLHHLATGTGSRDVADAALGAAPVEAALLGEHGDAASDAVAEVLGASFASRRRRAMGLHIVLEDGRIRSAQDEQADAFLSDLRRGEQAVAAGLASADPPDRAFATALSALHSAVSAFKHDPIAHFLLGWLELFHSGDAFGARATFERAAGCRRVDAEFRCLILRHIACALDLLAQRDPGQRKALREQALDAISEALAIAPEDPVLQWETARHCAAAGRVSNARRLLTEAVTADPALAIDIALDPLLSACEEDILQVLGDLQERSLRAAEAAARQAEAIADGLRQMTTPPSEGQERAAEEGAEWEGGVETEGFLPPGSGEADALEGLPVARALLAQGGHLSCAAAATVARQVRDRVLDEARTALGSELEALHEQRERVDSEAAEVLLAAAQLPDEAQEEPEEPGSDDRTFEGPAGSLLRGALGLAVPAAGCLALGGHYRVLGWALLGLAALMCVPQVIHARDRRVGRSGAEPADRSIDPEEAHHLRLAAADYREQLDHIDGRIAELSAVLSRLAA